MRKNYNRIKKSKYSEWDSSALSLSVALLLFIGLTTEAGATLASPDLEKYASGKVLAIQAAAPNVNAGPDKMLSCANTTVQLEGSSSTPGAIFSWTAGDGGNIVSGANTATPIVDAPANYRLTVTVDGVSSTDVMRVDKEGVFINPLGTALDCNNPTHTYYAITNVEGAKFVWTGPNGFISSEDRITVAEGGTYTVTVTNPETGCQVSRSTYLGDAKIDPGANAGPDQVLTCNQSSVTLVGSADNENSNALPSYSWYDSEGNRLRGHDQERWKLTVSSPGTYIFEIISNYSGCSSRDTVVVTGDTALPDVKASAAESLNCNNSSVKLQGSSSTVGVTYSWIGPNNFTSSEQNVSVSVAGEYTLTVTDQNGCSANQLVVVNEDKFKLYIFKQVQFPLVSCTSPKVKLQASAMLGDGTRAENFSFAWTGPGGFTAQTQDIIVETAGEYTLTATNPANGCTATAIATVTGSLMPQVSAGPDKQITCNGRPVALEGSSDVKPIYAEYSWTASDGGNIISGANTPTPIVDAPGTYTISVFDFRYGCVSTDVVKVTRDLTQPDVSITSKTVNCSTVQLSAESNTEGVTYHWTGPNDFFSKETYIMVTEAGNYTLKVVNWVTGCITTKSMYVHLPNVETTSVCNTISFAYAEYNTGLVTTLQTKEGPVAVMGMKRNPDGTYATGNYAAIFDTQAPTGDDTDLYTSDWGQALIINQDMTQVPNDNQYGGELILDFSAIGPVTMESLKALDIDEYENMSWVYLYDGAGKELYKVQLQNLGNNSKQEVNLGNTKGVMKMRVVLDGRNGMEELAGSGAIDDIKFCVETATQVPCEDTEEETTISEAMAYPNPFSGKATLSFTMKHNENYTVQLFDMQGNLIRELNSGQAKAGEKVNLAVDGSSLLEGMYVARILSASGSQSVKMIIKR